MKQFSLEEYLKNPKRKVITRDGKDVRIICTDFNNETYPIVGEIPNMIIPVIFTKEGLVYERTTSMDDLFFAPEKHEGYACIHFNEGIYYLDDTIYASKEEADNNAQRWRDSIALTKIEWED